MTYTLRLLTVESRDLVVEALLAESDKRTRVAQGAAQHVAADKQAGVKDVRSSAVRVAMLLAEAGQLADLARELRAAEDVPVYTMPGHISLTEEQIAATLPDSVVVNVQRDEVPGGPWTDPAVTVVVDTPPDPDPEDDGLSPAAQALAALAGLDDAKLDEDDPTLATNATVEDDLEASGLDADTVAAIAEADAAIIDGALG